MRKITFERVVLGIFILIILISTSDITGKYIKIFMKRFDKPLISSIPSRGAGFPTMLMNADNLFKEGDYERAAEEYIIMTLNNTLNTDQKIHAYFNLGVCQFILKKYNLAAESFKTVNNYDPNDSLAYNNAAVSALRANNIKQAIELEKKALDILPAVEYYYNLARMYEDNGEYDLAANNYLVVAEGEQNLTRVERIDPVRVKEKVARLRQNSLSSIREAGNDLLRVYKLEDNRNIFTLNENEMKLKEGDFIVRVENQKTSKNIIAEYDRAKYDPYNLISELLWTIYKDGKVINKKSGDKVSTNAKDGGNYEVKLNIKYNGNNEKVSSRTVKITEKDNTIASTTYIAPVVTKPISENSKIYEYASYEQLFESSFLENSNQFTDKYNVVWGKDDVKISFDEKMAIDKSRSLIVNNASLNDGGIWVNLDMLLKDMNIKGKLIKVGFYARKITENASLDMIIRVKSQTDIATTQKSITLDSSWDQKMNTIYIPEDCTGLTISVKTQSHAQFNIDGFILVE